MAVTANFYAGDTDKLYTTYVPGGLHVGVPASGNAVQAWRDESTPGGLDALLRYDGTASHSPTYNVGAMQRPSLMFQASASQNMMMRNDVGALDKTLANLFGASAKTLIVAARSTTAQTNNATVYQNSAIFADVTGYFGLHAKYGNSILTVHAYNWDGNADSVLLTLTVNTSYVIMVRHDGTNLSLSVLSGGGGSTRADTSVASGATTTMTGQARVGISTNGAYWHGQLGELYCDNTDLGSTNAALTAMVERWLPPAGNAVPVFMNQYRQRRM